MIKKKQKKKKLTSDHLILAAGVCHIEVWFFLKLYFVLSSI